jgi:hypothetical protein
MVEDRICFEMVHDRLLEPERVDRFGVLVLPNVVALSDAQCDQLRAYVERGGSVVATHETSLCDAAGEPRVDFGLADLFGVSYEGRVEGPMKNAYLGLDGPHPVLVGLEGAERIIHGVHRLDVTPAVEFPDRPVTLIPAYTDLPMEEVYPRTERTDTPELYLRQTPGGRVAYFNWDIGRTFWDVLCRDHGRLLANTIRWALGGPQRVEVTGAGVLDVAAWRQRRSLTVHMVNLTNPMMLKGPYRELLPSPPQTIRVQVPSGQAVTGARFLVCDRPAELRTDGDCVETDAPSVLDHEVLALDLQERP